MKKDRYRELFERSADAILIIEGDRFVDCNEATLKMLCYKNKSELLNTHPSELSPERQPDDRLSYEKANEMMALALANGTHRFEWNHKRADGEVFPVEVLLTSVADEFNPSLHVVWREITDRKKAEESLRRLTSIVESTSDLVATANLDNKIMFMNHAGRTMLGWSHDDTLEDKNIPALHPEWASEKILQEGLPQAIERGIWFGETAIRDNQCKEIPVSQVIMAHKNRHGRVEYLSTIMRDISERKTAERFLANIINTVADPIFVKDNQHRYVALNDAFCDFVGFTRKDLLQKTDFDFFPKQQAQEFRDKDELVLGAGGENINEEIVTDSEGIIHIVSTKKSTFIDQEGNRFLVGVMRDISALKKSEKSLHDNLQLLNSIIENLPVCVKVVGRDGTLLEMNPAGLAMVAAPTKEAVIGRQLYDIIVEEDLEAFIKFNQKVCEGHKRTLKFRIKALDGSLHHMDSLSVPLHYGVNDETVQLGITRDITENVVAEKEKEKLENRLRHSQKMEAIGTLAGGIAHDFNNILSAILGYTQLSLLSIPPESNLHKDLSQVFKAGNRAKDLVSQILTFSRRSDRELQPVRIPLIILETVKLLRATLPTTIKIVEDVDQNCHPILADPSEIHQLLMNLCTNAYHAMRETGGTLAIILKEKTGVSRNFEDSSELPPCYHALLEIRDTGVGMSKEIASRIFDPYFTTKKQGEGTGLGLAVVHGIVKSYGGQISLLSELGKGTTFRVYFPCIEDHSAPDEGFAALDLPTGKERILLVDDEYVLVDMLGRILTQLGYQVEPLTNSIEALELFRRRPDQFDLVITDLTMPELTGDQLAAEMIRIRPDIPIILCTGFSDRMNEPLARKTGIRRFLTKPVTQQDLAKAIREVLGV